MMTIVSSTMATEELVAFLREADDFAQFSDLPAAVREGVRILIDRAAPKPVDVEPNLMRRAISRVHAAGFYWDASQGYYVEADARFKQRIKIDWEFRERLAKIREAAGTTMQKLYIDDACLRIDNMSLTHEIETVAVAIEARGRYVHMSAPLAEPDDSYKRALQDHIRAMA
jgi:hypothetical protein